MNRLLKMFCVGCIMLAVGCGHEPAPQQRGDKTRETVAKATERAKPEIQWTAEKLGQAAKWAADEAEAAVEGFFEGWTHASAKSVNVNSASERQLESLPGITHEQAVRIVRFRPYRDRAALVTKGAIPESAYRAIKDRVTTD